MNRKQKHYFRVSLIYRDLSRRCRRQSAKCGKAGDDLGQIHWKEEADRLAGLWAHFHARAHYP